MAALRLELEIKSLLCNPIRELPVITEEIRNQAKIDKYITEKKKQINRSTVQKDLWLKGFPSVMDFDVR